MGNILRVKFKLDLFNTYHTDPARQSVILSKEHLQLARDLATKCPVLLKNDKNVLPLSNKLNSLCVIGPLAEDKENQIGCWAPDGQAQDSVTPLDSLLSYLKTTTITYAKGLPDCRSTDKSLFA